MAHIPVSVCVRVNERMLHLKKEYLELEPPVHLSKKIKGLFE